MKKTSKQFKRILALLMAMLMLASLGVSAVAADNDGITLIMGQVTESPYSDNAEFKGGVVAVGFKFNTEADSSIATSISIPATSTLKEDTTNTPLPVYGLEARDAKDGIIYFSEEENTINGNASAASSWIKYLTLPESIKFIGADALAGCTNLAKITFKGTCKQWSEVKIGTGNEILDKVTVVCTGSPKDHVKGEVVKIDDDAEKYKCTVCGEEFTIEHNYKLDETSSTPASCGEDGYNTYVCQNEGCGHEMKKVLPATGLHRFDTENPASLWTPVDENEHKRACSACGEEFTAEHRFTAEITTRPTCTKEGVVEYTCIDCGYKKNGSVDATGHAFTAWGSNDDRTFFKDGTLSRTCAFCGETETMADENSSVISQLFHWITGALMFKGHVAWEPLRWIVDLFYNLD